MNPLAEIERRRKISENAKTNPNYGMKGKHFSEKSKERMSKSHGNQIPWIKGKRGVFHHSDEYKEKLRVRMTGSNNPFYGKTHTEETKKKLKLFSKGMVSPRKGVKLTPEQIEKVASKLRGRKQSPENIRKRLRRRTPSSLELKMIILIEKHNLPYRFVGNGSFFIEGLNPDFVNCNGEKIAVEVFYRKHKNLFAGGLENWKFRRLSVFRKYGWDIIFLDETEVNESNLGRLLDGP